MGKIIECYIENKEKDYTKIYLIHTGIFYLGINDDAKTLNNLFKLKIISLGNNSIKVGFPENKLDYYTNLLDNLNKSYEIIELNDYNSTLGKSNFNNQDKEYKKIIKYLSNLDIESISYKDAYKILDKIIKKIKNIK